MKNIFEMHKDIYKTTDKKTDFLKDFEDLDESRPVPGTKTNELKDLFKGMALEYENMLRKEESGVIIPPDTTGVDYFFSRGFMSDEMWFDFWEILQEYVKQKGAEFKLFSQKIAINDSDLYSVEPEGYIKTRMLDIIYSAAKSGDEYSIQLLIYLYKTYHKKEYNQVKKFRRLTGYDINSIAADDVDLLRTDSMARVLAMSLFLGKEVDNDSSLIYFSLNKFKEHWDSEKENMSTEFPDELYGECLERVDKWLLKEPGQEGFSCSAEYYDEIEEFIKDICKREGFSSDYIKQCDKRQTYIDEKLAMTLAHLTNVYPEKEFTYQEVQCFAHIYNLTVMLLDLCKEYEDVPNALFGMERKVLGVLGGSAYFNPEKVTVGTKPAKITPLLENVAPVYEKKATEEDYMEVISELRRKLRETEQQSKHFRLQYDQTKMALSKANEQIKKYENDRKELISLRNHVYSLSQEEVYTAPVSFEEMKDKISERRIVIVGGHPNFVNKLRKEYPMWKYYDANVNKINETIMLSLF